MDLVDLIKQVVGAGIGGSIVVAALLWLTRKAIAKAIELQGAKEIEKYKGDLDKELEEKRQTFTRELERERERFAREIETMRAGSSRELESLKAELSLPAEVRRQVAAKKFEVVQDIFARCESIVDAIQYRRSEGFGEQMNGLRDVIRRNKHLFPERVAKRIDQHFGQLGKHNTEMTFPQLNENTIFEMEAATNALIALMRDELGVERASNEESTA